MGFGGRRRPGGGGGVGVGGRKAAQRGAANLCLEIPVQTAWLALWLGCLLAPWIKGETLGSRGKQLHISVLNTPKPLQFFTLDGNNTGFLIRSV